MPIKLEEAGRINECNRMQSFGLIAFPLAMPGVISVGLLICMAAWSECFIPMVLDGSTTRTHSWGY
jgi:multiple sugar transport system permease protein